MGRKRKLTVVENVKIIDIALKGKSIGKVDNMVYFVADTVPGDVVDVMVTKKKANFREGRPAKFHEYSKYRVEPKCEHFGTCGGCKWQNISYEQQLFFKEKQVSDNLTRIAKVEIPEVKPILPSKNIFHYRNKLEFTFSDRGWLTMEQIQSPERIENRNACGFHLPGRFDRILDVNECHLQPEPSNSIRLACKKFANEHDMTFYNVKEQEGLLRQLVIRTSTTGEVMVIVIFHHEEKENRELLLHHLKETFPEITSLNYIINPKFNDTYSDLEVHNFSGKDHIIEEMEGLKFKVGPKSFYQTNSDQAYELYRIARDFAQIGKEDTVYDLYTGTGTIACFVAKQAKKVVGVEYIDMAIEDAKENAILNDLTNTAFYAGDIKDVLNDEFVEANGKPDIIITDPPRVGMHQDVVKKILELSPKRIVYVSCNPSTQARDIELMGEHYEVLDIQPVDMFPHTYHVENVVLLEKK